MDNQNHNQDPVEICPNCMEPNTAGLANCVYCGMPMHADENTENPSQELNANSPVAGTTGEGAHVEPDNTAPAKPQPKKQNKGFTYAMRGMGLYLIVYAISEIPRSLKLEKQQDRTLSLVSNVIYLIAGVMIAWPMLKEYLDKRKKANEEPAIDTSDPSKTTEVIDGEIVEETPHEDPESLDSDFPEEEYPLDEQELEDLDSLDDDVPADKEPPQR